MIRAESDPYELAVELAKSHVMATLFSMANGPEAETIGLVTTVEDLSDAKQLIMPSQRDNIMPEALRRLGWDNLFDVEN
jgi:hypothetical protein